MKKPHYFIRKPYLAIVFFSTFFFSLGLFAQQPEPEEEDIERLSPFEIEETADTGYRANETISGSRIATPRVNVPVSMNVVTEELLGDIAATNLDDAIKVIGSANLRFAERDQENFTVRGFFANPKLRDGIPVQGYTDTANIQRVEVVKGAQSVFYGQASPGGLINYATKQPNFEDGGMVKFIGGSYEFLRGEVDVYGTVGDPEVTNMAYRYNGAWKRRESEEAFEEEEVTFHAPSFTWDVIPGRVKIGLDAEFHDRDWVPSQGPAIEVGPDGQARFDRDFGGGQEEAAWRGPDDIFRNERQFFQTTVDVKINHFIDYRFSFLTRKRARFVHARNPAWLFGPKEDALRPNGKFAIPTRFTAENSETEQFRSDFLLRFGDESAIHGKHNIIAGFEIQDRTAGEVNRTLLDPTVDANGDGGDYVPFWDPENPFNNNPDGSEGFPLLPLRFFDIAASGDANPGNGQIDVPTSENIGFDAYYINGHSSFGDGKYHITYGWRRDEIESPSVSDNTWQAGAVAEVFEGYNLFATWSTSLRNNGIGAKNEILAPETGEGYEFGIHFDELWNGRFSGSISYFNLERDNIKRVQDVLEGGVKVDEITVLSGTEESTGVDFEFTVNMSENWSAILSGAFFDPEVKSNINNPAEVGLTSRFSADEIFRAFTKYRFPEELGPLSGLTVGAGIDFRGEVRLFNPNSIGLEKVQADERTLINLFASYSFEMFGKESSISVNVDNVTDKRWIDRWQGWGQPITVKSSLAVRF